MTLTPTATPVRDRVRRLARLITVPLLPEDYLDLVSPLRSGRDLRGRIEAVHPETRDAATLVVRPGRGWRPHTPGQFVRLGVDVDGVRQWRSYSLTSPVRPDGCFTVTVKAQPDGIVSRHLVHRARRGTVVQLDQAAGEFTLPPVRPPKVLFVTAGSGITPVMGMLRACIDELDDIVLVHSARTGDDVIFGGELRALAARGRLRLVERHTATDGRLTAAELAALVPDLPSRAAWACGPSGLLDDLERHYADARLADRLRTERFRPVLVSPGEGGTATFVRQGVTVDAGGATPLLEAGETAGVLMPSGCRMGVCFRCVLPLRQGAVRDLRNGDVTTAQPGDGVVVQTCISAAAGPCELDV